MCPYLAKPNVLTIKILGPECVGCTRAEGERKREKPEQTEERKVTRKSTGDLTLKTSLAQGTFSNFSNVDPFVEQVIQ